MEGREKEGLSSCDAIIAQVSRQNSLNFINRIRAFHESWQVGNYVGFYELFILCVPVTYIFLLVKA